MDKLCEQILNHLNIHRVTNSFPISDIKMYIYIYIKEIVNFLDLYLDVYSLLVC